MTYSELIDSINIVDYISQYVKLTKKNGEWWGLSPFKLEKTPSFSVREKPAYFYDFSSGIGGGLHKFVMIYHNCTPQRAVEIVKKYANCSSLDEYNAVSTLSALRKYQSAQEKAQPNITYLPEDVMERYDPEAAELSVWEDEGISQKSMRRFDVRYDRTSNRIVYPIKDIDGRIVNIAGRTLEPQYKEKGINKYIYFYRFGRMNLVYGLWENMQHIKRVKNVVLFEGVKSVLLADTWGIRNSGALLTSHLSTSQMRILAGLGCSVVFALDKDADARTDKNIMTLSKFVNVSVIEDKTGILESKDSPVDKGRENFLQLYAMRSRI